MVGQDDRLNPRAARDHGGGLDGAMARYGGARVDWIDLSTGINPAPYPVEGLTAQDWAALPDHDAFERLVDAARSFWQVPDGAAILPAPGASALIARLPMLAPAARVEITPPTYNEHAAAFVANGWTVVAEGNEAKASVHVHPNNPDGRLWAGDQITGDLRIIDESFCDVAPEASLVQATTSPGTLVLKSFGKFWGLAGVRLGFVIGDEALLAKLSDMLGPWSVPGPALHIGTAALEDRDWAATTRQRLLQDADQLDRLMTEAGATCVGGTTLFRLYDVPDAKAWQTRLARGHVWSRVFPYNPRWLRLGLPDAAGWDLLHRALQ